MNDAGKKKKHYKGVRRVKELRCERVPIPHNECNHYGWQTCTDKNKNFLN